MKNEIIGNGDKRQNEAYEAWANIDDKNNSPDWGRSYKNPANEEKYEKNLNSMDEQTKQYIFRLPSNIPRLLGEYYEAGNQEVGEITDSIIDKMCQNICDGGLNDAYLDKSGHLHISSSGSKKESNERPFEEFETTLGAKLHTGDAKQDNLSTMDERTKAYFWSVFSNLPDLVDENFLFKKGLSPKDCICTMAFRNKTLQALTDGKLNGAYLANDGNFYIGKEAELYRSRETGKLPKVETPTQRVNEKTPEELGFRDW